jgi:hypothetical protein
LKEAAGLFEAMRVEMLYGETSSKSKLNFQGPFAEFPSN